VNLTQKDVQEIVALLDASSFDELIIETARFKLTLRRGGAGWTEERETRAQPPNRPHDRNVAVGSGDLVAGAPKVTLKPGEIAVHPPLTGTFYRAPKPGAAPFVDVGSKVDTHTVVAIIESMKLMTPVEAGAAGTVAEICVSNATFVEQGAVLMKLRK
jgi:acetyl-CoA carboxylase biotin carboxyl carrier protein